jgi:SRSO17 transposase
MAAALDPVNTRSQHQALHHFVADSPWSDQKILNKAWQWVDAHIPAEEQRYLIVDDTGIPKKGTHSVGVSHQYCVQLGNQANCQVAVSVSLASEKASVPVAWRLYLPTSCS